MSALDTDRDLAITAIRQIVDVPRETLDRLDAYVAMLLDESTRQNLIAASTTETIWTRHILDSAQLLSFVPTAATCWLDIGAGAGLPGIPVAILTGLDVTLVEPRKLRTEFLWRAITSLRLESQVTIMQAKIERAPPRPYSVISARAVANLDTLLAMGQPFAASETIWILPKGRSAQDELESAACSWQARFELVPSITDAEAAIVIARDVRRRRA
jgi:16S rRNA (guanine527-N7)-methyltransferase